jgi:hypothetical protein
VTWRIDDSAIPSFAGFATLRDLQFGEDAPTPVYQLVPITSGELDAKGEERQALFAKLYANPSRMIGVAPNHG